MKPTLASEPVFRVIACMLVAAGTAAAQTPNYVAKFNSLSQPVNSQMFDNGYAVGIGTLSPVTKLTIRTQGTNDGVRVLQGGSTAASVGLFNLGPGGHSWGMFSMGAGNLQGAGNFSIYDYSVGRDRLFITGTGEVGVDTYQPLAKLHVNDFGYSSSSSSRKAGFFELASSTTPVLEGVRAEVTNLVGLGQNNSVGVRASASTPNIAGNFSSYNYGVFSTASGGHSNEGGHFQASSPLTSSSNLAVNGTASGGAGSFNVGGYFTASGGQSAYGVYAQGSNWAGFFLGNVFATGLFQSSDARLKRDVQGLEGALSKLAELRPATYRFRSDEYPELGLPEGRQLGFIAQDVERVFPELVKETQTLPRVVEQGAQASDPVTIKSVNYTGLIPVLVSAVQEQQRLLDAQGARLAELEARLDALVNARPEPVPHRNR